jgi:asparagine synthase (glutamine-hydrolysing)
VLGGDGADELFAGYDSFVADRLDALTAPLDAAKRPIAAALAAIWPASDQHFGVDFRLRQTARALAQSAAVRGLAWTMTHTPDEIRRLFPGAPDVDLFAAVRAVGGADRVDRALRILVATYLEGDILPKLDRAGMAHGLEVRSPFLDHHLAEIAAALPASFKLRWLRRKWLLRRAFADHAWSAKHGFWVPVARWINGELRAWFDELLLDPAAYRDGLIDRGAVEALLRRHRRGGVNLRKPLWNLAMLFAWKRRWL